MFVKFPWRFGYLEVGKDPQIGLDACVRLALGRVVSGSRHRFNLCLAWDWLPERHYASALSSTGGVDSSDWTGRKRRLVRFGAWRTFKSLIRIRP